MINEGREYQNYRHRDDRERRPRERQRSRSNERDHRRHRNDRDPPRDAPRDNLREKFREKDRVKENINREREHNRSKNYRSVYKIDFNNRPTLFDISPPGYEATPVLEFKQLKATGSLPVMAIPQGSTIILRARRLYLENLPEGVNQDDFIDFMNTEIKKRLMAIKSGNPVIGLDMGHDGQTAYIEFRTAEEANTSLLLDGVIYNESKIKITRPIDYQPHSGYYFGCPHVFQDTLNKLFVACVPVYLSDDQVKELLCAFGELKAFNLVKDGASGLSKGYAFCEYRDGTVTDIAIAGLNGMQIADKKLVVQRAVLGSRAGTNLGGIIPSQMQVPGVDPDHIISHDLLVTEILCLMNMISASQLAEDQDYEEIIEDVQEECSKYGKVISIEIPRPDPEKVVESIGKVFVEFETKEMCKEAHEALAGRKFGGNLVITTFYDLEKYKKKEF
ncbi:hypothetical protein MXB_177 [Myxobolus squamalis]|nr:hypothetical protein MXB_177 [Myxobolus squamalis]